MRFNIVLASAFAALASAQSSSSSSGSSSSSAASTSTRPVSPVQSCVNSCTPGDVNCQAACLGTPYPGAVQANQTTDCVAKCDQGDGSVAGNNAYRECRDRCISSFILTSSLGTSAEATATAGGGFLNIPSGVSAASSAASTGAAGATGSAASSTGSSGASGSSGSSGSAATGSSGSGSSSSSPSGSSSSSTSTGAANSHVQAGSTVGGIAGLIMAVLAM